ncbi:MAG: hypothetical protein V4641_15045 [Pseudomonadota bacterium]
MTAVIPVQALPNQTFTVQLGTQQCRISIFQNQEMVCMSMDVNSVRIITSLACRDRTSIIRHAYLGFIGELAFVDTQGVSDPFYTGLGSRFKLVYLP